MKLNHVCRERGDSAFSHSVAGCEGAGNRAWLAAWERGEGAYVRGLVDEFRAFILRGNVLDLAVAVVIGAAFTQIVNSLVENIITPIIAAIGGQPDFSGLTFTINNSVFRYGAFINSVISFLIIALIVYFLIVKPMNVLMAKVAPKAPEGTPAICPQCFSEISAEANRCPNCTSWLKGPNAPVS
jgi:large conductance mechanosensitive channel